MPTASQRYLLLLREVMALDPADEEGDLHLGNIRSMVSIDRELSTLEKRDLLAQLIRVEAAVRTRRN